MNRDGVQPFASAFDPAILDRDAALARYRAVRRHTLTLAKPLSAEDMALQSMPEASPTKWHLGHTTWFFETFILRRQDPDFSPFDEAFAYLFNSYYEAEGPHQPRPERGLLSRPSLEEVMAYRASIDAAMELLIARLAGNDGWAEIAPLLDLGCQHEQQHQELLVTDIKHALYQNPLRPAYTNAAPSAVTEAANLTWSACEEGVYEIGHAGEGFAYDCEGPRHKVYVQPCRLASRPVTNGEFLQFIADGGYQRHEYWLSDGWAMVQAEDWQHPLYWEPHDSNWQIFTLSGMRTLNPAEPVCHLSYYEADAYAAWAGARLPREAELELAQTRTGAAPAEENDLSQTFGNVWEWTASAYSAYPGFRAAEGAVGEYNGKFMCGQFVLKGGSSATPKGHVRPTYRNFFYPHSRWQFTGLRLARDV